MNDDMLAALVVDREQLGQFEGSDVLKVGIEIPSAAGGLREAMKFAPVVLHKGDEVYVLLKTNVTKIRFDPITDTEAVARVHILDAEEATFVDGKFAEKHLKEQRDRIRKLREEAQGIRSAPGQDGEGDDPE